MNIGVYGSAAGDSTADKMAYDIGVAIARNGHTVVTGSCNGVPQQAVLGAKSAGGEAIGFSAHINLQEHKAEGEPVNGFSKFVFIPEDFEHSEDIVISRKYRNITSVAFADAAIFINGRIGTLNEFTNAHDFGKCIGVLKGSGGVADEVIPVLLEKIRKPSDATVIFESDPTKLVEVVIKNYEK